MKKPFYARFGLPILLGAALLFPLVIYGARGAMQTNTNDVRTWLSKDYPETKDYRWFKEQFGTEEFILVSWEGCTLSDRRLEHFASRIQPPRTQPESRRRRELIQDITTGPRAINRLTAAPANLTRDEALERLAKTLIGPDGVQTGALITPTDQGKEELHEMLDLIRQIATDECAIPAKDLRMGGPPVINAAVDVEGGRSLTRLAGLSGVLGLAISWWCFRSWKLTFIVFFIGAYAAQLSLAIVYFSGGTMNAILLTMPPLVYVAVMSGGIHLVNYYREALAEAGPTQAPASAIAHARVPLALATSTTAIGLLSLAYSDLLPIQQFGIYSALGVAASSSLLFLVLPAILQLWPLKAGQEHEDHQTHDDGLLTLSSRWRYLCQTVTRHHAAVTAASLALLIGCASALPWMRTSIKVERFFKDDAKILQDYTWLENHLAALVPMELVIRMRPDADFSMLDRMQLVSRVQESIEELPDVGSTISAATFAPELTGGTWLEQSVLNRRLNRSREELIDVGYFRTSPEEDLWRVSIRVNANNDVDYGIFVTDIKEKVEPVLAEAREVDQISGVSAVYTGMVPVIYKAQRFLLNGLLLGFSTDLILIVLAIAILLRHWSAGMVITIISLFPAGIVFGLMSWTGIIVDIGTVMTPSVALGVTVDDVVHFLLWYRRGISQGLDRRQSVMLAYEGCAKPMYQSWGVIGLGLASFALSPFIPTMRFGALMVSLLTVGLICNLILMPALLAGPLGEAFARGIRRRVKRQQPNGTETANGQHENGADSALPHSARPSVGA